MLKNIFLFFIILVISSSTFLQSQLLEDKRQHALVLQGIDLTLQQQYDSAEIVFQTIMKEFPHHPSGYLYLAGMMQAKNTDYGDPFNEQRYDSLLNIVENLAQPLMKNKNSYAFGYFYIGSSEAFRSYTRSENGNLASGIYYGISAGSSMERCLETDPNFAEAKNILGSFYYWRSKMSWIPFISDRTEEGIKLILESYSHPYEKHLASHNLMVIFTEEKRYADAEKYGLMMLKEYPDNRLFLWDLMTTYERWNNKKKLSEVVERLLQSTIHAKVVNRYTEGMCRLKIAQYALTANDTAKAKEELKQVISLKKYIGSTRGDLRKKISKAEDILETLEQQ